MSGRTYSAIAWTARPPPRNTWAKASALRRTRGVFREELPRPVRRLEASPVDEDEERARLGPVRQVADERREELTPDPAQSDQYDPLIHRRHRPSTRSLATGTSWWQESKSELVGEPGARTSATSDRPDSLRSAKVPGTDAVAPFDPVPCPSSRRTRWRQELHLLLSQSSGALDRAVGVARGRRLSECRSVDRRRRMPPSRSVGLDRSRRRRRGAHRAPPRRPRRSSSPRAPKGTVGVDQNRSPPETRLGARFRRACGSPRPG